MRKHIALGAVLALGVGAQAMAAESLSYSYVEGAFVQGDMGTSDLGSLLPWMETASAVRAMMDTE